MERTPHFVVVGAGQAGGWAARTLRKQNASADIFLVGDEPHPPHERPPLSKDVLLGLKPPHSAYIFDRASLSALDIALRHARVLGIDRKAKRVFLADGDDVPYDRMLLAVGSRVRQLNIPGSTLAGICTLRSIEDSLAVGRHLNADAHIMIVGGGWIGLEVASAARHRGARVTVVEFSDRLCSRALPHGELAQHLLDLQRRKGVDVRLGTTVTAFGGTSVVEYAVLANREELPVSAAVVGIGILPNVEMAQAAGLDVENGVVVDQYGRTSDPDIFAAGDCTSQPNEFVGRRIRLESWANAQNQALAAANAMSGHPSPYQDIPWFWSDQHGVNVQLLGEPNGFDEVVTLGDPARDRFVQYFLAEGRVVAWAGVNSAREMRGAKRLMKNKDQWSPEALARLAP